VADSCRGVRGPPGALTLLAKWTHLTSKNTPPGSILKGKGGTGNCDYNHSIGNKRYKKAPDAFVLALSEKIEQLDIPR